MLSALEVEKVMPTLMPQFDSTDQPQDILLDSRRHAISPDMYSFGTRT